MNQPNEGREEKTAEGYWFEYSHESIVEGLRAITEANFKQAIRMAQTDLRDQLSKEAKMRKELESNILLLLAGFGAAVTISRPDNITESAKQFLANYMAIDESLRKKASELDKNLKT